MLIDLGKAYLAAGRPAGAVRALERAEKLVDATTPPVEAADARFALARARVRDGGARQARGRGRSLAGATLGPASVQGTAGARRSTRAGTCLCHGVPTNGSRASRAVSSFGATPVAAVPPSVG